MQKEEKIGVVGLGYVGLPLAVELSQYFEVVGYDIDTARIDELTTGFDRTYELSNAKLENLANINFTSCAEDLCECSVYIVTVSTPVDEYNIPDLAASKLACASIAKVLNKGSLVIFESTVFPGATEEIFVPLIEEYSNLKLREDFDVGYSPERINPGDSTRNIRDIKKVVSANRFEALQRMRKIYGSFVDAGLYEAANIKTAEAAKVIENIQRDINIALVNEFSIIFEKLGLNTSKVLDAASTKWNFHRYTPGLVGGHCIGVDPYYLTHKAQEIGYYPELILAGRRINENMASHAARLLVKKMLEKQLEVLGAKILILGFTFKENCPDIRNTKVADLSEELMDYGLSVDIYEPLSDRDDLVSKYPSLNFISDYLNTKYSAVILAVPHNTFVKDGPQSIKSKMCSNGIFFDLKQVFRASESDISL